MASHEALRDPVTDELLDWIEASLGRIAGSVAGLSEAQVRATAAPSGWSIAGLVGHVHASTRFWLHNVIGGNAVELDERGVWDNDPIVPFPALLERVTRETSDACAAVRGRSSEDAPGWWPEGAWGGYRQHTVRGVLMHVLNDDAAHVGHLDIVRELLDGTVWDDTENRIRTTADGNGS